MLTAGIHGQHGAGAGDRVLFEANWRLSPLTSYSEDNLPNPAPGVYVPANRPAIGNLMTVFDFGRPHYGTLQLEAHPASSGGVTPDFVARMP